MFQHFNLLSFQYEPPKSKYLQCLEIFSVLWRYLINSDLVAFLHELQKQTIENIL